MHRWVVGHAYQLGFKYWAIIHCNILTVYRKFGFQFSGLRAVESYGVHPFVSYLRTRNWKRGGEGEGGLRRQKNSRISFAVRVRF